MIRSWLVGLLFLSACTSTTARPDEEAVVLPEQTKVAAPETETFALPAWTKRDVQPKSARFGDRYGLEAFRGKALVVVLLEGYCPYCQSNSVVAQRLQDALDAENRDAQVIVLGDLNAEQFASKVSLPIFEDDDGKAWDAMRPNASKHDTFVYGPDGKRTFFWLGSYQDDATRWTGEVGEAIRAVAPPRT
jgi:hypothetical protein